MSEAEVLEAEAESVPTIGAAPPEPPEAQPDGVFIERQPSPDGNIGVAVRVLGDTRITEVQTILELAMDSFRAQVGLAPRK